MKASKQKDSQHNGGDRKDDAKYDSDDHNSRCLIARFFTVAYRGVGKKQ